MVLQKLVQLVAALVDHEQVDHQLVDVVLD